MMISAKENLLVHSCLRCWDQHDEIIKDPIVWLQTKTMMASVRRTAEVPMRVSRFCFLAHSDVTIERLRKALPPELHGCIEPVKQNEAG